MPYRAQTFAIACPLRALSLIACGALAAACGAPTNPAPAPASQKLPAPAAAVEPAVAKKTARIPLMLFPHDSNLLVSVNIGQLTASSVYQELFREWVHDEWGDRLEQLRSICSISLLSDVGRVLSAHSFDDEFEHRDERHMMSVQGLSRPSVRACTKALVERKYVNGFREDGRFSKVDTKKGPRWHVWLDDQTAVVPSAMTLEQLRARMGASDSLHNNVAMAELANLVERDATVWGTLLIPEGSMEKSAIQFHSVYGWIHVGEGVDMRVGFRHADLQSARKNATELAEKLDQLVNQSGDMGKFFDGLEVGVMGQDMVITLSFDPDELKAFLKEFGPILRTALQT